MQQPVQIIINGRGDTIEVNTRALSAIGSRRNLAAYLGNAFDGDRDYYRVLGYKIDPFPEDYLAHYTRDDIAGRVVDLPAQDTWKKRPVLIDGDSRSDDDNPASPFIKAWQQMTESGDENALNIFHYLERVDRLAGIGRFGVLVIGIRDGKELSQPVDPTTKLFDPSGILYLRPVPEYLCQVNEYDIEQNPQSRRFGKLKEYKVDLGFGTGYQTIHHSRAIHVVEDALENEVIGRPRLERVLNRIDDLIKIVGGGAEATWKVIRKGLAITTKDGYQLPDDEDAVQRLNTQLEEYEHGLRRILKLAGMEVTDLGSQVVDPSGLFRIIISLISAASDIPQRILIGSERGELASSQDERAWGGVIRNRQVNFAEPVILRPFINKCIRLGALPPPLKGRYKVEWPPLFETTAVEDAEIAQKVSEAISDYITATGAVDVVSPSEYREKVLKFPAEKAEAVLEEGGEETGDEQQAFEEIQQSLTSPAPPPSDILQDLEEVLRLLEQAAVPTV